MTHDSFAQEVLRHAQTAGDLVTSIPGLSLHRRHAPTEPLRCIYPLSLTVVVQGSKRVQIGKQMVDYLPGHCMLTTVDQPLVSHVTAATPTTPFLAVMLALDLQTVLQEAAAAATQSEAAMETARSKQATVTITPLERAIEEAMARLVRLLNEPHLAQRLHALSHREIVVRLLMGAQAQQLHSLAKSGPRAREVARAIVWIKEHFDQPLRVDELAAQVHVSQSCLREHFRSFAGVSPLQFQKQLRLQHARQLMVHQGLDAAQASRAVGYESPSQFSREYGRLFGAPPMQDVRALRLAGFAPEWARSPTN